MAHKPTMTLQITNEQKASLREIASLHDLKIGRGSTPEMGSIRKLIMAIADKKLMVVKNEDEDNEDLKEMTEESE